MPDRLEVISATMCRDASALVRALVKAPLPPGDDTFAVLFDAVRLTFARTIDSAVTVFEQGDHCSSGALARVALEYAYALHVLKAPDGSKKLISCGEKSQAVNLHSIMRLTEGDPAILQADLIRAEIRNARNKGHGTARISEAQLASLANLSQVHVGLYGMLNPHAHFDLFSAIDLYRQVRESTVTNVSEWLVLDRARAAEHVQEVALIAAHAYAEMIPQGAPFVALLLDQVNRFRLLNSEILAAEAARGIAAAIASGWRSIDAETSRP